MLKKQKQNKKNKSHDPMNDMYVHNRNKHCDQLLQSVMSFVMAIGLRA